MEKFSNQELNNKNTLKPWHGILMFLVVMLSFFTIIAWMQIRWGMYGLALTELYLLLLALAGTKWFRQPLKRIFPIERPEGRKIGAVLLFWLSSYALVIPFTMLVAYFFPKQMFLVGNDMNALISSVPPLIALFITAVMPAICEEAVHRGFILKSLQNGISNVWLLTILMGILFGLFHGSIWRFIPTAILGGVLSYIMIRTENLIYPMLFHFINNSLPSLLASILTGGTNVTQASEAASELMEYRIPLSFLGIYCSMLCIVPFGFYTANYMLKKRVEGEQNSYLTSDRKMITLVVLTVSPMILGIILFVSGLFFKI